MKNWADVSSDEESDHGQYHPSRAKAAPVWGERGEEKQQAAVHEEKVVVKEPLPPPPKTYEFPTDPPFTSFVGNLAFSVTESQLAEAISNLAQDRLQKQIRVLQARIAIDRNDNKPRGFGYVEVETVDDLKALMDLNDGKSAIAGRTIKLDVAQPHSKSQRSSRGSSRGSFSDQIDGSSFRGGRYARGSNSSLQRESSATTVEGEEGKKRPSLKLAPRSKAREGGGGESESAGQSIFGGAKPRDATTWAQRQRRPSNSNDERRHSNSSAGGGRGGRGGRGRGGDGRRRSSSGRNSSGRGSGKEEAKKTPETPASPVKAVPSHVHEPEKVASTKKVVNKFAALQFDSDSE